jgi:ketosteroid isomerase-like protein
MESDEQLVRHLWSAIDRREWSVVESLCEQCFSYTLPQSDEVFGREDFIRLNKEYPGDWRIRVEHLICASPWVVTEVLVEFPDKRDRGVTFFRVHGGKVVEIREYWPEPFPVPAWRQTWKKEAT